MLATISNWADLYTIGQDTSNAGFRDLLSPIGISEKFEYFKPSILFSSKILPKNPFLILMGLDRSLPPILKIVAILCHRNFAAYILANEKDNI
mmetsp:Transcript_26546/g.66548  ORF Transcript_26546/g.66548 Transcript_26546/m.66548 type:complete len:93 (-) Transcript_26546:172-450(-)